MKRYNGAKPTILRGIIADQKISLLTATSELVDNSIDAGAHNIKLNWDNIIFRIEDDGVGLQTINDLLTFGESRRAFHGIVALGRYGKGGKDALVWLGNKIIIESRTVEHTQTAILDYQYMMRAEDWVYDDTLTCSINHIGTRITVEEIRPYRFTQWHNLTTRLAENFRPAITAGIRIFLNDIELAPIPERILDSEIRKSGEFEGKFFELHAGIIPQGQRQDAFGYTVDYGARSLVKNYAETGFGNYSPKRFYGHLLLKDGDDAAWQLSVYKDSLEELDRLTEYLFETIEPILQAIRKEEEQFKLDSAADETIKRLGRIFRKIKEQKERRNKPAAGEEQIGTIPARNTGRKRKRARHKQDGAGVIKEELESAREFRIDYYTDEEEGIGKVQKVSDFFVIHLNEYHAAVQKIRLNPDRLTDLAINLLGAYCITAPDQMLFDFMHHKSEDDFDRFSKNVADWLNLQIEELNPT